MRTEGDVTLYHAAEVERGLAVWVFAGANRDEDWQRWIDDIGALDAACPDDVRGAGLSVFSKKSPPPGPRWLKRIADGTQRLRMNNPAFALVSDRMLVRGIVGAVERMRPSPYESTAHKTVDTAMRWLRERRDEDSITRLRALLDQCERAAR
jgi:hypothetical protein